MRLLPRQLFNICGLQAQTRRSFAAASKGDDVIARVYLYLLAGTVLAALGQVLFKVGATGRNALLEFVNVWIIAGLVSYALSTMLWIYSLSRAQLTIVYPFTALTFVLVYLVGVFVLGEATSLKALVGVAAVLLGLFLISTA
jgi:undecaprenyl phosphate-alpha-L-ara4N flippase subunit ArnE